MKTENATLESKPTIPAHAYGVVLIGLASISISPILVRLAGDQPALSLAALRNLMAVALLAPLAIYRRHEFRNLPKSAWGWTLGAGFLLGFHFYTFFEAIQRTTIASATVFVSLTPIFLAILSYLFFKERLSRRILLAIVISVSGGLLMAWGDMGADSMAVDPLRGNILALVACLLVSIYLIIGRMKRQQLSWLAYVYPVYVSSAVTVFVLAMINNAPLLGLEPKVYLLCGLMAIFPHILGHGSFNYSVKYFTATFLGLASLTEPIGATAMAYVLFGEQPLLIAMVGMALALAGVIVAIGRIKILKES